MGRRLDLHTLLLTLGTTNVYFQPPENLKMDYPAIVYERDLVDSEFAGNKPYKQTKRYQVTVIDRDPDSQIPDRVGSLPMSRFTRSYVADNLNHSVYNLYF